MLAQVFTSLVFVILTASAAGCTGALHARSPVSAAVGLSDDVSGTWRGSHGQVAASLYLDEANWVLRMNDDGTFEARVVPAPGANNRAKAGAWTGSVVATDNRVALRSDTRWPWLTLARAGDDVLYAVAVDSRTGADIMIRLERDVDGSATR